MYKTTISSPLGKLTLTSDGFSLTGLFIEGQKYFLAQQGPFIEKKDLEVFLETQDWLKRYFSEGKPSPSELPLKFLGTEFRKVVWQELLSIPYGETVTYKELGKRVYKKLEKKPISFQAIGGAVGHNPISIIVPCHRVIGSDGSLVGYAGGIEKKEYLLHLERNS